MDSQRLLERIEAGERSFSDELDGMKIHIDVENADSLGLLLCHTRLESPRKPSNVPAALRRQAEVAVERLAFLDDLKVIEVDGIANAVQIRSRTPRDGVFTEVVLRGGDVLTLERRNASLHLPKQDFPKLLDCLAQVLRSV